MAKIKEGLLRTHTCGELKKGHVGELVTVCGWVNKDRNLGGLHFVDLRDKYGITQISFSDYTGDLNLFKDISLESVILVKGVVGARPDDAINKNMATGEIEVRAQVVQILSIADKDTIPFLPYGAVRPTEELGLRYRYLDLRTKELQDILQLRSNVMNRVRALLIEEDFVEVETPILYKSTPEGARDYIVPSRVHPGKVYALPQSPQTLKQLLMIASTDKYFQIAKCFRDEDLRADRQPEFTQIDIETSFPTPLYIKKIVEKILIDLFKLPAGYSLPVMSYDQVMEKYGSDKPDLRYGLEQYNVTSLFANSAFATFADVAQNRGLVKAMFVSNKVGSLTRKMIDQFKDVVAPFGGKGVAWFKMENGAVSGGIAKFITDDILSTLYRMANENNKSDGVWLFIADNNHDIAHNSSDALRRFLGENLKLIGSEDKFLWVEKFPLFEWNGEDKRFYAKHHPFTSVAQESMDDFLSGDHARLVNCKAEAYDVVCNGYEIGGGSIRIHNQKVQDKMFQLLGMSESEIRGQFGFFIDALKYGVPPHGGLALGLDRLMMILARTNNIKDVIAFPKTTSAADLMADAPSVPAEAQLNELKLRWK